MSPDSLLKLRKSISETMLVAIEYLRDRWDASVAGTMGLHPNARVGTAETATGSRRTLTWDSIATSADDDPLILSAVRALALWLREGRQLAAAQGGLWLDGHVDGPLPGQRFREARL